MLSFLFAYISCLLNTCNFQGFPNRVSILAILTSSLLILPAASMAPSAQSAAAAGNRQPALNWAVCAGVSAGLLGFGLGIGLGALIFRHRDRNLASL